MKKEEKSREMTIKLEGEIGTSPHSRQAIEESMSEMADWALSHQWVSIEDEFPKKLEGEIVSDYVYVTNGYWYDIMRYEFNEKIWLDCTNGRHWGITHWMPIPKLNKD